MYEPGFVSVGILCPEVSVINSNSSFRYKKKNPIEKESSHGASPDFTQTWKKVAIIAKAKKNQVTLNLEMNIRAPALVDLQEFPALYNTRVTERPLVYLDSVTSSQIPSVVLERMKTGYKFPNSVYSLDLDQYRGDRNAAEIMQSVQDPFVERFYSAARKSLVSFLTGGRLEPPKIDLNGSKTQDSAEGGVVFISNGIEGVQIVSRLWGMKMLEFGDEILLSLSNQHGNILPWQILAEKTKSKIILFETKDDDGQISGIFDMVRMEEILSRGRVKLIAIDMVSGILGTIAPIEEICKLAHKFGAKVFVDGTHALPRMRINVEQLGCDWFVGCAYTMCGPLGVGFLYGKLELLKIMDSYYYNDYNNCTNSKKIDMESICRSLEPNVMRIGAVVEMRAFLDGISFLDRLRWDCIRRHDHILSLYAWNELSRFEEVTLYGSPPSVAMESSARTSICSFSIKDAHPTDVSAILDLEGIGLRSGDHHSQPLLQKFGVQTCLQISPYVYNSTGDIDTLIEALKEAVELLGVTLTEKNVN